MNADAIVAALIAAGPAHCRGAFDVDSAIAVKNATAGDFTGGNSANLWWTGNEGQSPSFIAVP